MDSYDAIRDQLRRAQARGLETVTNRLDFVVETLEELVKEARASVQEAVPEDGAELFPIEEVEHSIGELADRIRTSDDRATRLEETVADLQARLRDAETSARGISLDVLRTLDAARSQSELLRELLPLLSEHVARAVVLVVRGGTVTAWSGIGFDGAEQLRGWQAEITESPVLTRFVDRVEPVGFMPDDDRVVSRWLGGETPATEAVLLPIVLRGKLMGAMYADRVEGSPWNLDEAQSLVALGCWMIDTLHHRQSIPFPGLAEVRRTIPPMPEPGAEAAPVEEEAPPVEAAVDAEPEPDELAETPPEEAGPEDEWREPSSGVAGFEAAPTEASPDDFAPPVTEREAEPSETWGEPAAEVPEEIREEETPPEAPSGVTPETAEPEAGAWPEPEEGAGAAVPEPPPPPEMATAPPPEPVTAVEPPSEAPVPERPSEEDARHEEARRFARLLVSEIKLYNEEEVDNGRENRDLYHRLKEDIDRSREMYEKRIAAEVREDDDYFHDELVRILADGDEDALGM